MIHSKILSIYNELELFVQNLFHGITQIYFRHHSPELLYSVGSQNINISIFQTHYNIFVIKAFSIN